MDGAWDSLLYLAGACVRACIYIYTCVCVCVELEACAFCLCSILLAVPDGFNSDSLSPAFKVCDVEDAVRRSFSSGMPQLLHMHWCCYS